MALVPFVPAALGSHAVGSGLMNLNPKQRQAALRKAAEVHALYNVPYMTKTGAVAAVIRNRPRPKSSSKGSVTTVPAAIGTTTVSRPANVGGGSGRSGLRGKTVRISHSALFDSVYGGATGLEFPVSSKRLNPGLGDMFPWLSSLAGSFDMYRLVSLNVRYVPVTGTDTEGAIYLAWDPDPSDPDPTTKGQVMSFDVSSTGPVWKPLSLKVPSLGTRYVRRGDVVGNTLNTYDNGKFLICQQGTPSQLLGDLYVDYTIELSLPHIVTHNSNLYTAQSVFKLAGDCAQATPLGTLPPKSCGYDIVDPLGVNNPSAGVVTFPLKNVNSYSESGVTSWRVLVQIAFTGTNVAYSLTCSDSGANIETLEVGTEGTTELFTNYRVTWSRPPLAGTYFTFTSTSTTLSSGKFNFLLVGDSQFGLRTV